MIDESIAQKLINRIDGTIDYNINIMDENGRIIASRDAARIGNFHEIAYSMIRNSQMLVEVYEDENRLGTKPGINMAIEHKNDVVGVVGITGNPEIVRPYARLLKAAIESILDLELQQKEILSRTSAKDRFYQQLLYREDRDASELNAYANYLGLAADKVRIPIYLQTQHESDQKAVFDMCSGCDNTRQEILIQTESGSSLVFLHIAMKDPLTNYRTCVETYLGYLIRNCEHKKIPCRFLVGSLQTELVHYRDGYLQCHWMKKKIPWSNEQIIYFYDHVFDYLQSKVPFLEQYKIWEPVIMQQSVSFWKEFVQIIGVMRDNNNNMVRSSERLHMHKNTLVYHYNRIRETLNIDPLKNSCDDVFAKQLCFYLENR